MNHDHAYISLVSLIDHFLSFNLEMNYMTCDENNMINTGISKCKMALQMRNSVKEELKDSNISPMILYINLWSDDFEPNVYRKNRKSIWIKTVSICPPRDKITSPMYTYVLAIGRKTDNHDIMHEFYNRELEDLSKCAFRYCALVKKMFQLLSRFYQFLQIDQKGVPSTIFLDTMAQQPKDGYIMHISIKQNYLLARNA